MKLFPKEILEHTSEYFVSEITIKSRIIYLIMLIVLLALFISLPFVKVTIYTSASGFIKPDVERLSLTTINSGKILFSNMTNNKRVRKGDTLLVLQTNTLDEKLRLNGSRALELAEEKVDLELLTKGEIKSITELKTLRFQKQFLEFQAVSDEYYARIIKTKKDMERSKLLYSRGVIARVEFEEVQLKDRLERNELGQHGKKQLNIWQAQLLDVKNNIRQLENERVQINEERSSFIIKAPINGTVLINQNIAVGSFIAAGNILGEITPTSKLVAECYVSPNDIGLLDKEKSVKIQINAFNHNHWGFLTGDIISIADDVEFINNQPLYRVQCSLSKQSLSLKNGHKGQIGKGMTLQARFELAERTLYQLLYDKTEDWLNSKS